MTFKDIDIELPVHDNNQNEFDINVLHKLCYVKDH